MRPLRAAVLNTTLVVASVLLLGVVAEIALQVVTFFGRPRFTRLDPALGWTHNADVTEVDETEGHSYRVTYNRHGYRVPDWQIARQDSIARVVLIGDSFVDGSEVGDDELFTVRLQAALHRVEVINLGVYGFQSAQQSILLDSLGHALAPDLVVVVGISNDLPGNVLALESFGPAPRFVLDADSLRLEDLRSASAREALRASQLPAPYVIRRHSLLYHLLNTRIYQRLGAARITAFTKERLARATDQEKMEVTARIVERMHRSAAANGADFLYVLGYLRDELPADVPDPFKGLRQRLEARGVPVVDLRDSLRAAQRSAPSSLYYQQDIHWSAQGHAEVARLLTPIVDARLRARTTSAVPPRPTP